MTIEQDIDIKVDDKVVDIYIKDEGYGAIKALTPKAKLAAYALGFDNELCHFGKTWCGQPVCQDGQTEGLFQAECGLDQVQEVIELFESWGLVVYSEL